MSLPVIIKKTIPITKRMWLPLLNLVGEKNEFRIIVTSPNYMEIKLLWGAVSFEKGEKKEFVLRGTDAYINSVISSLNMQKLDVKKVIR